MDTEPAGEPTAPAPAPHLAEAHAQARRRWAGRRAPALLAAAVYSVLAAGFIVYWNRQTGGGPHAGWHVQQDLYGTQLAASALVHGHLEAIYTSSTALVTFPGILVVLAPAVGLAALLHWSVVDPSTVSVAMPTGWLFVEVASVASSLPVLFVADAMAERLGAARRRRFLLAAFEAVAVWNVVVWWGHPEDALAVALVLGAIGPLEAGRYTRAAWLVGAGVAVQPVVLLAVPLLFAPLPRRAWVPCGWRMALPSAVLLAGPVAAGWHGAVRALVEQPNYPQVDHTTPWTSLAPSTGGQSVSSGPLRGAMVALALAVGVVAGRRVTRPDRLAWGVAVAFAVRVVIEPVMVAYYVWPVLAVGCAVACAARRTRAAPPGSRRSRRVGGLWRLLATGTVTVGATLFGDVRWKGNWSWWAVETGCVVAVLVLSWPRRAERPEEPEAVVHRAPMLAS